MAQSLKARGTAARSAIAACAVILAGAAEAQGLPDVWRFTKAKAGLFATELTTAPPHFRVRLLQGRVMSYVDASYLPQEQVAVAPSPQRITDVTLDTTCVAAGTYTATSSVGREVKVRRHNCKQLILRGDEAFAIANVECPSERRLVKAAYGCDGLGGSRLALPMTPAQFRDYEARGLLYEIEFDAAVDLSKRIAQKDEIVNLPKLGDANHTVIEQWVLFGRITGLSIFSADGRVSFGRFERGSDGRVAQAQ